MVIEPVLTILRSDVISGLLPVILALSKDTLLCDQPAPGDAGGAADGAGATGITSRDADEEHAIDAVNSIAVISSENTKVKNRMFFIAAS
jgi:hypothetical protein